MNRKTTILAGASAFALLLGSASMASAQDVTDATVGDSVSGNTVTGDIGQNRANLEDLSHTDASGIAHVQQNNGQQNAIDAASSVDVNINSNNELNSSASVTSSTSGNFQDSRFAIRDNDVQDSFGGFSGAATVQQNNGDHNVINAATSVHTRLDEGADFGDVNQEVTVTGTTSGQTGDVDFAAPFPFDNTVTDEDSDRTNDISGSFNNASGIATVQQNNGNANAIGTATAVAVDVGGIAPNDDVNQNVLVEGSIGENAPVVDVRSDRSNDIDNSFNEFSGIANVQENNGDVNVLGIGNAVNANIGLDFEAVLENDVSQSVSVLGEVFGATSADVDRPDPDAAVDGRRSNDIGASFNDASGIANVQQNNGSQNVMGIGNAVQANIDSPVGFLNSNDQAEQFANTVGGTVGNTSASWGFGLTPVEPDTDNMRRNLIDDSFDDFSGMATVQQNNGDNNVIGASNAVVATIRSEDKLDQVTNATAQTTGSTTANVSADEFPRLRIRGTNRDNTIEGSFDGAEGIVNVQQNNGSNNVMSVANTVVANVENDPDNDAALNSNNFAQGLATVQGNLANPDSFTDRVNLIDNSFNGSAGMSTVQQNNGSNNVMGSASSVSASINNALDNGFSSPALTVAGLGSVVAGNTIRVEATVGAPGLENTVVDSYTNAAGIMITQQNNGSNNAIGSAVAVTANINGLDGSGGGGFLNNLR